LHLIYLTAIHFFAVVRYSPREYYSYVERVLYIKDDIPALVRWEVYRDF